MARRRLAEDLAEALDAARELSVAAAMPTYLVGGAVRDGLLGLEPRDIVEFKPNEQLLARFFFVQDPDGYKVEVLQRHGHYQ